jgi:hypothetical protein
MLEATKVLHQNAGVDTQRTSQGTRTVSGTRFYGIIFILTQNGGSDRGGFSLAQHFPAQHDALAGSSG